MKAISNFGLIFILLSSVVVPMSFAQDSAPTLTGIDCDEDLTGESVSFYHFGDLSGPYASISSPVLAGFEDAITYFNANGGICGAEIRTDYQDTGARSEIAQSAWDDFVERGDANVMILYVPDEAELLRQQAAEAQIPIIVASGSVLGLYGEDANTPGWVFSAVPLYTDQLGAFCDYVADTWAEFGIDEPPVIGHVSWIGSLGEASDTEETQAYCAEQGVGYAGAQYYFPGLPSIETQIQNVVDNGANILYTTSLGAGPAQMASTVAAMDFEQELILAGPNWVLDTSVMTQGGESVAGMIGQLPYIWWDEIEHPGIQLISQYWAENRLATASDPSQAFDQRNIAYLLAWATVDFYRAFITLAVNEVGFENLSGAVIYDLLISGQEISALDGVVRLQYSDTIRAPQVTRMGTIEFVESGNSVQPMIVPLTDWVETPDLRPNGSSVTP